MSTSKKSARIERVTKEWADAAETSITESGQKIISHLIEDAAGWLMSSYEKWKRSRSLKPKYEELQRYIEVNNEATQIGMDKKELAVMWAMRKLGYTEEERQKVLDLANKAYLPREER